MGEDRLFVPRTSASLGGLGPMVLISRSAAPGDSNGRTITLRYGPYDGDEAKAALELLCELVNNRLHLLREKDVPHLLNQGDRNIINRAPAGEQETLGNHIASLQYLIKAEGSGQRAAFGKRQQSRRFDYSDSEPKSDGASCPETQEQRAEREAEVEGFDQTIATKSTDKDDGQNYLGSRSYSGYELVRMTRNLNVSVNYQVDVRGDNESESTADDNSEDNSSHQSSNITTVGEAMPAAQWPVFSDLARLVNSPHYNGSSNDEEDEAHHQGVDDSDYCWSGRISERLNHEENLFKHHYSGGGVPLY